MLPVQGITAGRQRQIRNRHFLISISCFSLKSIKEKYLLKRFKYLVYLSGKKHKIYEIDRPPALTRRGTVC